jgi:signal transduction histidine kinase
MCPGNTIVTFFGGPSRAATPSARTAGTLTRSWISAHEDFAIGARVCDPQQCGQPERTQKTIEASCNTSVPAGRRVAPVDRVTSQLRLPVHVSEKNRGANWKKDLQIYVAGRQSDESPTYMSELEKLRLEVQELRKQLEATRLESRSYLQNVAHQLTAPLSAIKWNIEALKNPKIQEIRRENLLRSVYSQATIVVHLIKNFALMSNLDADKELGQLKDEEPVNLLRLAINYASDFRPQAFELNKRIEINDKSFDDVLRGREVRVEKNLIAQAISNVIENAVKYADVDSTIVVSAATTDLRGVGVAVTSTGIAIDPSESDKVFQRSYRGTKARQTVAAGTGIGLFLAKRIMVLHGGDINLVTTGRLSRFTLILPAARYI